MKGLLIKAQSGFYTVLMEDGQRLTCQLRGRLKQGRRTGDVVSIGDWVEVTPLDNQTGAIEAVQERAREFVRLDPTPRGVYRQILIANPDQAVIVFACAEPEPRLMMLDRFLVTAEKQAIPALIVANKVDLVDKGRAVELFGHYPALGYPVLYASARAGQGVEDLRAHLAGKVTMFAGPSGVGKSTLLNSLQPGLGLAAREVSQATTKGKHTTVVRQLFPLEGGGWVADTPGLKALGLWDIEPEELDAYFPELNPLVEKCQFNDCTHTHEPGCAVLAAVQSGSVHPDRYQSYLRMRFGHAAL